MTEQIKTPSFKPLYQQVKALMLTRLTERVWTPGMILPSEAQLASEFGVSQGTVRKALDELTAVNLLRRSQGRGTFVSEHTDNRSVFHFLNLVDEQGNKQIPLSRLLSIGKSLASASEAKALDITRASDVIRLKRLRYLDDRPVILETITLPYSLTPGLEADAAAIPNTLYQLYEKRYGFSVTRATERLTAVAADSQQADLLQVDAGSPLLRICRLAFTYNAQPVELRVSVCCTDSHQYLSELT